MDPRLRGDDGNLGMGRVRDILLNDEGLDLPS
ncbi:hypothetical protein IL54_0924 [Sphingobium sp. ba1]|nr:hypothetical protein IL54_0924 [Sphingobium sp. ba1]